MVHLHFHGHFGDIHIQLKLSLMGMLKNTIKVRSYSRRRASSAVVRHCYFCLMMRNDASMNTPSVFLL